MAIHNYQKWRTLALLALGLCFLLELLSNRFQYGWMRNSVGVLVVALYALLGMLFAYLVLFQLPGAPTVSSRSFFANLTPCGPPTIEYVLKMFMLSVVAAICLWPAIGIVSTILRRSART